MKLNLLLLFVLIFPTDIFSQYNDFEVIYDKYESELDFSLGFTVGDFNQDGSVDIMTISRLPGRILFYANNGDGTFQDKITVAYDYSVNEIESGDLNGDGKIDLIYASDDNDEVYWMENLGNAEFGPKQLVTNRLIGYFYIQVADLEADGDMDIVIASYFDNLIETYVNDGNGVFNIDNSIDFQYGLLEVITADLDNDGKVEIFPYRFDEAGFGYYKRNENDTYDWTIVNGTSISVSSVSVEDMDLDGDKDIMMHGELESDNSDVCRIYLNNGDNTFQLSGSIVTNKLVKGSQLYDIDGDGDIDLLYGAFGNTYWRRNQGGLSFGPEKFLGDPQSDYKIRDYNGDGELDIMGVTSSPWWIEHYDARNTDEVTINYISNPDNWGVMALDYSIKPVANSSQKNVYVAEAIDETSAFKFNILEHQGGGDLQSNQMNYVSSYTLDSKFFDVDVDGNGIEDILFEAGDDAFAWISLDNQGEMIAESLTGLPTGEQTDFVILDVADVDGDDDMDVLLKRLHGTSTASVTVYYNDGAGLFGTSQTIIDHAEDVGEGQMADVDGDGDFDVVIDVNLQLKQFDFNNGTLTGPINVETTPTFVYPNVSTEELNLYKVDLNNDGNEEILAYWSFSGFSGGFYYVELYGVFDYVTDSLKLSNFQTEWPSEGVPFFADYNGDSIMDMLALQSTIAQYTPPQINWYLGDGSGLFAFEEVVAAEVPLRNPQVKASDYDGDGDLDVFALSRFAESSALFLYRNQIFSNFDFDGDGIDVSLDCNDNDSTILDFLPLPQTIKSFTLCVGETLEVDILNENAGLNYTWNGPGNTTYNGSTLSISDVQEVDGGIYSVISSVNDCASDTNFFEIIVLPSPLVEIAFNDVVLTATSNDAIGYQWYLNDVLIPNAVQAIFTPFYSGDYYVEVVSLNGCVSTSNILNVIISGLNEENGFSDVQIYPNPVQGNGQIIVAQSNEQFILFDYQIVDVSGRLIQTGSLNSHTSTIDLKVISSGMYLLELKHESDKHWYKLSVK